MVRGRSSPFLLTTTPMYTLLKASCAHIIPNAHRLPCSPGGRGLCRRPRAGLGAAGGLGQHDVHPHKAMVRVMHGVPGVGGVAFHAEAVPPGQESRGAPFQPPAPSLWFPPFFSVLCFFWPELLSGRAHRVTTPRASWPDTCSSGTQTPPWPPRSARSSSPPSGRRRALEGALRQDSAGRSTVSSGRNAADSRYCVRGHERGEKQRGCRPTHTVGPIAIRSVIGHDLVL